MALAVSSAAVGALLAFLIARYLARDLIRRRIGRHVLDCTTCSDRMLLFLPRILEWMRPDLVAKMHAAFTRQPQSGN